MKTGKLGKQPKRSDQRTFKLSKYLKISELPAAPPAVDWTKAVPHYGMLLNDQLGDCVIAGMMHLAMGWQANAGQTPAAPSDAEVIATYSAIGGYNPSDPTTDQGCNMLDALNYWRNTGISIGGAKSQIVAFAEVDLKNDAEVKAALWLFGGLFTGFQMPVSAENATTWSVPSCGLHGKGKPGSWGGHCAPLAAENASCGFEAITWGGLMPTTHNFVSDYCEEAYAVLSPAWIETSGQAPSGFDLAALQADLAAL
ncbi:MAG TPA: hypothetical protein VME43_06070 [Bryobacteraceae bacterium]|nr:hypothetical protein [Bryobacteraceae bacterium]